MRPDNGDLKEFQQIQQLYNEAERFIKEVEVVEAAVAFPAINQLRYAGHHLLKALVSEAREDFQTELNDIRDHCHRAMYEAAEAGIGYLLELFTTFETDFKDIIVTDTVSDYSEIRALRQAAASELYKGRVDRSSPVEQVRHYMNRYRELKQGVDKLEASRSELNKVKMREVKSSRRFVYQVLFWISVVLIGIAGLILR
ncbi:MAG: hypothetical protein OXB98_19390 [Bryobacterales bacterium]|nr:hypothetical protein [Bryobacterales bacterium]